MNFPNSDKQGSDQASSAHIGERLRQQHLPPGEDQHLWVPWGLQASKNAASVGKPKTRSAVWGNRGRKQHQLGELNSL